jgi:hypothetical protein
MNAHVAHVGPSIRRAAQVSLPQRRVPGVSPWSRTSAVRPGWLELLAAWAERQPMHHRMGSYTHRM